MIRTFLKNLRISLLLAGVFTALVIFALPPKQSNALSSTDFQAGRIIDDAVFFNSELMSISDIQNFLNNKIPVCDTNGTQPYAGTTRAAYAATKGVSTPFICLRNYVEQNIPQKDAEPGLCNGVAAGSKSAAEIIYVVGKSCGVNQQALIVLLQKEQSLVTDDWPWPVQYQKATGYGCPDTAACDTAYYGFFNQVYSAARQFKRYGRDAQLFSYQAGRNNYIQYNPNTGCGGTNVYIKNQATAGLYNYTPYQPNPSALANLYGSGDSCGAYGNRNFWRTFNDWFGSTIAGACTANEPTLSYVRRFYNPRTFQQFYSARDCDVTFLAQIGYRNEGPVFNTTPCTAGYALPVYRLYNAGTGQHFWTTTNETPEQLTAGGTGYKQEAGVVFCVATPGMANVHGIHRLYNQKTYLHIWAVDPTPVDLNIIGNQAGYTQSDGAVFYTQ